MSTEIASEELSDQTAEESDTFDGKTCTTCGEDVWMYPMGRLPLSFKACGCGLVLEYNPIVEDGGPCPVCNLIEEHGLSEFGQDFTHTHVQALPVHGTGGSEPVADKGTRPPKDAGRTSVGSAKSAQGAGRA